MLRTHHRAPAWAIAALLVAPAIASAASTPKQWNPVIDPARFAGPANNPYCPLTPGRSLLYRSVGKSRTETLRIDVTDRRKTILGVSTIVVVETETVDGDTAEISENWLAADRAGNVWYFGELAQHFRNGAPSGTGGSWEAGRNNAKPGILVKARPKVGETYHQEYAPGIAEDMASVAAIDRTVSVPAGKFTKVLVTKEWNPLEKDDLEHKSYAPGVGLILEESGSERMELIEVHP